MTEEDRTLIQRLAEQVTRIAERIDKADTSERAGNKDASAFRFGMPEGRDGNGDQSTARRPRMARPPLPEPRMVRRIIRQRQLRRQFFGLDLFADPAWDMLLDLTAARAEHKRVSVTSLCIASGVPPTTALRWIAQMVDVGLFERIDDDTDRRRAFIALSDKGANLMARYFADLGSSAKLLV